MNEATRSAVTPTVIRALQTVSNRGELAMRDVVDAYMASYTGRDIAMAQRLTFWIEAIGEVRLRDVEADLIADHLDQLAAQPVRRYVGRDAEGHRLYRAHRPRSGATVKRYKNALTLVDVGFWPGKRPWRAHSPGLRGVQAAGEANTVNTPV